MNFTETKFLPNKWYGISFFILSLLGLHLTVTQSKWAFMLFFWAIWSLGLGYTKQQKWNPDNLKEG